MGEKTAKGVLTVSLWAVCSFAAVSRADDHNESASPLPHHVTWGRVSPGSSATLRTVSIDPRQPTGTETVSHVETQLVESLESFVRLETRVTLEVAGKRCERPAQTVREDFLGRSAPLEVASESLEPAMLRIGLRTIPCDVTAYRYETPSGAVRETVYVSPDVAPHLLKRETIKYQAESDRILRKVTEAVVSFRPPSRPFWNPLAVCYEVEVFEETATTTSRSCRFCSCDLPGAVYFEKTCEYDDDGQCIRSTRTNLVRCTIRRERTARPRVLTLENLDFDPPSESEREPLEWISRSSGLEETAVFEATARGCLPVVPWWPRRRIDSVVGRVRPAIITRSTIF